VSTAPKRGSTTDRACSWPRHHAAHRVRGEHYREPRTAAARLGVAEGEAAVGCEQRGGAVGVALVDEGEDLADDIARRVGLHRPGEQALVAGHRFGVSTGGSTGFGTGVDGPSLRRPAAGCVELDDVRVARGPDALGLPGCSAGSFAAGRVTRDQLMVRATA
jgi:hypothetical protein